MNSIKDLYEALDINPKVLRVAFQGSQGSFSEHALLNYFGNEVQPISYEIFSSAYDDLVSQKCDIGILPIENTLVGTIHPSFDVLAKQQDLCIIADETLKIEHTLIGTQDSSIEKIRSVYSQWPGLEQCRDFLDQHKDWETIPFKDTAAAAKYVAKQKNSTYAAIASSRAVEIYGLKVLRHNIESNKHNFTRFAIVVNKRGALYEKWQNIIAKKKVEPNVGWLVFSTEDTPGSLFKCLSVFSIFQINLHKIESRPIIGRPWEYQMTVELDLSQNNATQALKTLGAVTKSQHIVGMYCRAEADSSAYKPV